MRSPKHLQLADLKAQRKIRMTQRISSPAKFSSKKEFKIQAKRELSRIIMH
jgi:hypothetical protein